jgi:hypothetical protein
MSRNGAFQQVGQTQAGGWLLRARDRCFLLPPYTNAWAPADALEAELKLRAALLEAVANMPPLVPAVARAATVAPAFSVDAVVRTFSGKPVAKVQVMQHPELLDADAVPHVYGGQYPDVDLFALTRTALFHVSGGAGVCMVSAVQVRAVSGLAFYASAVAWLCEEFSEPFKALKPFKLKSP